MLLISFIKPYSQSSEKQGCNVLLIVTYYYKAIIGDHDYTYNLNVNCKYRVVKASFKCGLYVTCRRLAFVLPSPTHHCV